MRQAGRHFLQIPGPSPVPDQILRAIDMPVIDHRGPGFAALGYKVLSGIQGIFKTTQPVIIYPSSGTGAWEAALVNSLSHGDKVLMVETGHFASLSWYDEVASVALAWITYYGGALAVIKRKHIGFDSVLLAIPIPKRLYTAMFAELVFLAFFVLLAWAGWEVLLVLEGDSLVSLRWVPVQLAQSVIRLVLYCSLCVN
jgi:hypothetical protein